MPCSKGKANDQGERCAYAKSEPQTVEGWQAWDIALRCAGQLRMAQFAVIGIDMTAALKLAEGLGYDVVAISEFLPACENGMVAAINEKLINGLK